MLGVPALLYRIFRTAGGTFGFFIRCWYSTSYPVSSSNATLIILLNRNAWLVRFLGDIISCPRLAHNSIASCAIDQKLEFLLLVLWAGHAGGTVGFLLVSCCVASSGVKAS